MNVIFAGTPDFSVPALESIQSKHNIIGVFCQPDRPKGRGRVISQCPVKIKALEHGLTLFQPENLKDTSIQEQIKSLNPDVMIVVAYGQLIPKEILSIPKYGCINIHASVLPKWRGAAPIQRAIISGDTSTGISIMQMDEGLDTGDILLTKLIEIDEKDNAQSLHDKLSLLGASGIQETLDKIDTLTPIKQENSEATYAKKLFKDESWINWTSDAKEICNQIRGFNPYPIAQTYLESENSNQEILRIYSANYVVNETNIKPGYPIQIDKKECIIAAKNGAVSLEMVQLSGKKIVSIGDFLNANKIIRLF